MAASDVNAVTRTIASGAIALNVTVDYPTGSGRYTIECEGNVTGDELTSITGGSGYAMITLRPGTPGEYFTLYDNGTSILLKEHMGFEPQSVQDFITLQSNSDGSVWTEDNRGRFPV